MTVSIVQSGKGDNTPTVVFGAGPTNGNLLVFICFHWSNNPSASVGFTRLTNTDGATGDGVAIFYKYAGAGESTSQSPYAGGTAEETYGWELAGVTGTIGTDLPFTHSAKDQTANPTYATASFNTGQVNTILLGAISGDVSTSTTQTGAPTLTGGVSITTDQSMVNNTASSRHSASKSWHDFQATSGSAYTVTATFPINQGLLARHVIIEVANGTGGSSTETGTAVMTFAGISFTASASVTHSGTSTMAFAGISFSAAGSDSHTGSAVMGFRGISFSASGVVAHVHGAAVMAFAGISIHAAGSDFGAAGTGRRQFWTFGA